MTTDEAIEQLKQIREFARVLNQQTRDHHDMSPITARLNDAARELLFEIRMNGL